ncbi:MAG: GNAT family N-acetyltransferase [Terracidiphilus sp.]|jgi:RimJ/RimL family protein N-acetyltransferase
MTEILTTGRLLLRRWRDADREPFQRLNADPRVMECMPGLLTAKQSNEMIDRIEQHFERRGFGLFAAELLENSVFLGFIGLAVPSFDASFMPAVEIGWRLSADYWGRGLATEGAQAVIQHAFGGLGLAGLVSFTVPENQRSRRVMEKLGMVRDPAEDFDHPRLPEGHPLRRHVLYRLNRERWNPGGIVSTQRRPHATGSGSSALLDSLLLTLWRTGQQVLWRRQQQLRHRLPYRCEPTR